MISFGRSDIEIWKSGNLVDDLLDARFARLDCFRRQDVFAFRRQRSSLGLQSVAYD